MDYKELKIIATKYIDIKSKNIPINAFDIAQELGLRVKNSIEAKQDYAGTTNPLTYANGCLSLIRGEYVIYHDEKDAYKNFTVAHEIAHYLLHHESDGVEQHNEANLLAAILIAPKRLVLKSKIKSSKELSEKCKIPIEVAKSYWAILDIKSYSKRLISGVAICCIVIVGASTIYLSHESTAKNAALPSPALATESANTPVPSYEPTGNDIVYITPFGEKYHRSDCIYVENKDNVIGVPVSEAQELDYEECKVCF